MVGHFYTCTMLTIAIAFFCTTNVAAEKVCYKDRGLGCFDTKLPCNRGLWCTKAKCLPQSPSEINTEFYLFTPENPSREQVIDWTKDSSIINSKFQGSRKTKFIIHGFNPIQHTHIKLKQFLHMKEALLLNKKVNVILVDWKIGAGSLHEILKTFVNLPKDYLRARQNARLVGRQIGELSQKLQNLTKASFSDMHLIGFSLGAHVAGYAGEHVSREYESKYGRITGLDPAGPGYTNFSSTPGCLLEKTDADFVDIIHTDGILGNQIAVGHQDFYPSGGRNQISCLYVNGCSHLRAVQFFTESITSKCEWRAYPCSKWSQFKKGKCRSCGENGCPRMGYYADQLSNVNGSFFLQTNIKKPYCKKNSGQPPRFPFPRLRLPFV